MYRVYAVDLAPDLVDLVAKTDRTPFRLANEYVDGPVGQVNTVPSAAAGDRGRRVRGLRPITSPATASLVTAYLETPGGTQSRVLAEDAAPARPTTWSGRARPPPTPVPG